MIKGKGGTIGGPGFQKIQQIFVRVEREKEKGVEESIGRNDFVCGEIVHLEIKCVGQGSETTP